MTETAKTQRPAGPRFYERLGLVIVAVVFGGLILWSIVAPIEGAVIAEGQVVVESNRKTVQHLEGGVIEAILVREGEWVREGNAVARLDQTLPRANAALIDSQLTDFYARRARLEAERDDAEVLASPRGVEEVLQSPAFARHRASQQQLLDARRQARVTQVSLLQQRIVQQKERIGGFRAQIASLRDQLTLIKDELAALNTIAKDGHVSKSKLRETQRDAERLRGERSAHVADIAEARSLIAEANLEIERLHEANRADAMAELATVAVSISDLEERRIAAMDMLSRTEIRAPQSGRVLGLTVHTVGGVIRPGAPLMEIVPDGDRLRIEARVSPQDVDKVRPGQDTLVRFSSVGGSNAPEIMGQVHTVSADSLVDPVTGVPYYLVLADIPHGEDLAFALSGEQLRPGMPVEAYIRTGSRRAISFLLKPLSDAMARSLREE